MVLGSKIGQQHDVPHNKLSLTGQLHDPDFSTMVDETNLTLRS